MHRKYRRHQDLFQNMKYRLAVQVSDSLQAEGQRATQSAIKKMQAFDQKRATALRAVKGWNQEQEEMSQKVWAKCNKHLNKDHDHHGANDNKQSSDDESLSKEN